MLGGGARLSLAGALLDAGRLDDASKEMAEAFAPQWAQRPEPPGPGAAGGCAGDQAASQRHAEQACTAWQQAQGPHCRSSEFQRRASWRAPNITLTRRIGQRRAGLSSNAARPGRTAGAWRSVEPALRCG